MGNNCGGQMGTLDMDQKDRDDLLISIKETIEKLKDCENKMENNKELDETQINLLVDLNIS